MKAFSIHNAILAQVREEDKKLWATSPTYMPPTPDYHAIPKPKWSPVAIWVFIKSLRP